MAATTAANESTPLAGVPIDGYDSLTVKQILPLLGDLTVSELEGVAAYEVEGKNRVTLLRGLRKEAVAREAQEAEEPGDDGWRPDGHLTLVGDDGPASKASSRDWDELAETEMWHANDLEFDFEEPEEDVESDPGGDEAVAPAPTSLSARYQSTWEEEPVPTLPRRIEFGQSRIGSRIGEVGPPVIGGDPSYPPIHSVPPIPEVPAVSSMPDAPPEPPPFYEPRRRPPARSAKTAPTPGLLGVLDKFHGAALVMAAILAILLGLAIGTILARTGGTSAQPVPASAATSPTPAGSGS